MTYVALLRGINVGGKSPVNMAALKTCFEAIGSLSSVKTYINSGNVLFRTTETDKQVLTKHIEAAIARTFDQDIKVLLKTHSELATLIASIPATWTNDTVTKCDVLFLWPTIDQPAVLAQLPPALDAEDLQYYPGAIVHRVDRRDAAKSRLTRIVGTPLYAQMTLRNINTVRKLLALMETLA